MFGKNNEPAAEVTPPKAPKMPDPDVRKRNVSVIGPTLKFRGELSANEDLVIEGEIEGTIAHQDKNLTIGPQGRVKADIHASIVEIHGQVEGDVRGDQLVKMYRSSVVQGNVFAPRLVMEDGAHFSGTVDMGKSAAIDAGVTKREALKRANLSVADNGTQAANGGGG